MAILSFFFNAYATDRDTPDTKLSIPQNQSRQAESVTIAVETQKAHRCNQWVKYISWQ